MKQKLIIIFLIFFSLNSFAQNAAKIFDEVKEITVRNVGVIKKNNEIKGYFSFYEYDKVDKKTMLFKLNLMDEDLNSIGTKEIEGPKTWELISSGFDGSNFCFKFYDPKEKKFEMKVYNQEAKEVLTNELELNYGMSSNKYKMYKQYENPELNIVPDNGFINYTFNNDNDGFFTTYVNGTTKKQWSHSYEPSDGDFKVMIPSFLGGNENILMTFVTKVNKGMYTTSTKNAILATNINSGAKIFEIPALIQEKNIVPINVTFEDDKISLVGLTYTTSNISTSSPEGLAFVDLDKTGKVIKTNFQTFEESLGKYFPIEKGKFADGYSFFIHGIERTKDNTNILVGEKFRKKTSGGGMALTMMGGGGGFVKLELENMLLIEYDMSGKVLQAKEVPKAKGYTPTFPSYTGFFPPYMLAAVADIYGWMDYMYTLKNEDKSEITFNYLDYEKLEDADADDKKTHNFGQIKYKNGKITTDKIAIKNEKATFSHLYPAKAGYVLQMNYFKKKKQMTMDFIKLN